MAGLISGWIRKGVSRTLRADPGSHALISTGIRHSALHCGNRYIVSYSVADIGALTTPDDTMTLSFKTPNTTEKLHMELIASGTTGALLSVIEGKTGGGASPTGVLQSHNMDRSSANTSLILDVAGANVSKVSYDATVFTGGTTLYSEYLSNGAGPHAGGGYLSFEFILAANTLYQVTLYNAAANAGSIVLEWHAQTDLD